MLKVKIAKTPNEIKSVINIRRKVFINEQRVSKKLEIDGLDNISNHAILIYNNINKFIINNFTIIILYLFIKFNFIFY